MKKMLITLLVTLLFSTNVHAGTLLSWDVEFTFSRDVTNREESTISIFNDYQLYVPDEIDLTLVDEASSSGTTWESNNRTYEGVEIPFSFDVLSGVGPAVHTFSESQLDIYSQRSSAPGEPDTEHTGVSFYRYDETAGPTGYGPYRSVSMYRDYGGYDPDFTFADYMGLLTEGDEFMGYLEEVEYDGRNYTDGSMYYEFTATLRSITEADGLPAPQDLNPVPTPEPSTFILIGIGLFGLFLTRKHFA